MPIKKCLPRDAFVFRREALIKEIAVSVLFVSCSFPTLYVTQQALPSTEGARLRSYFMVLFPAAVFFQSRAYSPLAVPLLPDFKQSGAYFGALLCGALETSLSLSTYRVSL